MPKNGKSTANEQHKRFVEAARTLGCDEREASFDEAMKKIASAPPPKSVEKRKRKAKRASCKD